jgi:hypothetical protein
MKDDQRSLMEMNRDAKCTKISEPNRHLQPVITIVKQPKVEEIHIIGDQVMILKQKK